MNKEKATRIKLSMNKEINKYEKDDIKQALVA